MNLDVLRNNKEKRREILRIINPLPEPQIKKLTDATEQICNRLTYTRKIGTDSTISKSTVIQNIPTSGTNATKEGIYIIISRGPNNLNITGSVPLVSRVTKKAISSNIKTTLNEAILLAQKTVGSNSSAISGFIRPLNDYLICDIDLINSNNTLYRVIINPGNGKILYNHAVPSL